MLEQMILNKKEVAKILGVSPSTVERWAKKGLIPAPFKMRPNSTAWLYDEIKDCVLKRAKQERGFQGRRPLGSIKSNR